MKEFPVVVEEKERITITYSEEPAIYKEEDDGVDVVKTIINKDEKHHIIYF